MNNEIGKLEQIDITTEAKKAYLDYAMSVIVSRALPDVRDGLKPVHRRILFAMHEMGLNPSAKFSKSAKIVGETMGKYHPHGDMPIYDALVRLAQNFAMRYPLIHGQGNFGSMDGDSAAAMRYTEAKLAQLASELLFDIEKETVEFIDNFDGTIKEPVYLPGKLPNLLLMGSEGIAVGMATKIPPHNLTEIADAIAYTIDKTTATKTEGKEGLTLTSDLTIDELLEFIQGPDFPTGGAIFDASEIKNVYRTGRGRIIIRGIADIEDIGQGKNAIIVREIPYQVNKSSLVAKIAELAKDKKLEGISDLRDESDRHGVRIVIELKRDTSPRKVLNNLYKATALQTIFPANIVALVDGVPRTLNLKTILDEYVKHRFSVVTKRSEFELRQAEARLHILDGLLIAVRNIDDVVAIIRKSKNADEAKINLIAKFKLSEIQAVAILDMQLRRLAALEREKLEEEWKMVKEVIDRLKSLLNDPKQILGVIKDELAQVKEKFGDARKTKVYKSKVDEFSEEDLIQNEPTVITITKTGYVKRQSLTSFKVQKRGGKGIMGMTTKDDDVLEYILYSETHDYIIFFTNLGKVYQTRVFEIGEGARVGKGQAIVNLIDIESSEKVNSVLAYNPKEKENTKYVLLVTKKGVVKKTKIDEFTNIRRRGILAIKIDPGDSLSWVDFTSGNDDVLLVTKNGKIISFHEKQIRPTGRSSMGVRGIKLVGDDEVVGMDLLRPLGEAPTREGDITVAADTKLDATKEVADIKKAEKGKKKEDKTLLVLTEKGIGKKTKVTEFRNQNRGGQGIRVANITPKTGKIAYSTIIPEKANELIMTSEKGQVVKIDLKSIPLLSRNAAGVILMRFSKANDLIGAATCIEEE